MADTLLPGMIALALAVLALAVIGWHRHARLIRQWHGALQREADLGTALARAESAASAKTAFLANMSHEIRTPMNGVIGFTELLLASPLTDEQFAHAQMIADSGRAMLRLLNDILDVSKIESGQLRLLQEPTDIRMQLQHCTKLHEPMAREKGLALSTFVADDVPQLLLLDSLRVRQVVLNLIGNAVKFTESGGVDVEARVESGSDGRSLLIAVIDTGVGIEADRLDTIFTPYAQQDESVARRYGGTGLGLAIASQLAEMMQGRITVQSRPGIGTCFTLRLPLHEAHGKAASGETTSETVTCLSGRRVLLAEDQAINQQLTMAILAKLGIRAQLASNGEAVISAVMDAVEAEEPFDAVLMDVQMPELDGLEAARRLRALGFEAEQLPIIALTANCYPDDVEACLCAGMQAHLGKPVTSLALARELARCLPPEYGHEPSKG